MNQEERDQIALWRFGIIALVLHGTHGFSTEWAYFNSLSTIPLKNPVTGVSKCFNPKTLVYWKARYKNLGLDGLRPGCRAGKGSFRALTLPVQTRINELIEQYPKMPNTQIRERLKEEGLCDDLLSQSTIDRYIRAGYYEKSSLRSMWTRSVKLSSLNMPISAGRPIRLFCSGSAKKSLLDAHHR